MKHLYQFSLKLILLCTVLLLIVGCSGPSAASPAKPRATATIDPSFQSQLSPVPTVPPYRCGAWASNYGPPAYGNVTIYARITKDNKGVKGLTATGTVNFDGWSEPLGDPQTSDEGGYVSFVIALGGRQPRLTPATVDITFTAGNQKVTCSAFFTPQ
ncbi:hypothetical protein EI42_01415 [Thermosporothrix hazakensis]|jgi:hypothetical protein|uniref:Uncharacterized protein n=2 Tax=Thermosporothrix TaxID=768650 RepID=A0A326UAM3_THEHA|nr:hypothetical protein [Thermosporothrix hazakensis]PZW32872.1 hypothetical protein EI42_01415 [Thermosporothrix hazakensis]BBH90853.1 hypothetical protein KTC_56040 [Thermosporothrix sp. COM3]GCE48904.1 hypothetical protein KTH_37730 [Thermosporothrix hazakensis]